MAEQNVTASTLLVDEYFSSEDDRFVAAVREIANSKYLAGLVDRWKKDPRPWARKAVFDYLELPMNRPGHNVVVKRLFKHAEASGDDELMGLFMVAFDRLVRRVRKVSRRYDFTTRSVETRVYLKVPADSLLPSDATRKARNPRTGELMQIPYRARSTGTLFSVHTRNYVRRRVWRYFRTVGYKRPETYRGAITPALLRYTDDDLATGENILDNWSLLNALFRESDVLRFSPPHITLSEGKSLADLEPAPRFPELWRSAIADEELFALLTRAPARLVRVWAAGILNTQHGEKLKIISADRLLTLFESEYPDVQSFGAGLLGRAESVAAFSIETWLKLLNSNHPDALELIVAAIRRYVQPSRMTTRDCVDLACALPAPVAKLGFEWLQTREFPNQEAATELARVSEARSTVVASNLAAWALPILSRPHLYSTENIIRFFDSLNEDIRKTACAWAGADDLPVRRDRVFWIRLVETPYDGVRFWVLRELEKMSAMRDAVPHDALFPVWTSVLLGVHRGGRQKALSVRRLAEELIRHPESADEVLPVLAVALRSIRGPEHRAGLAAVAAATAACPDLVATVSKHIPELTFPFLPEASHA